MPLYHFSRYILIILCKVLFSLETVGLSNIPRKGGFILASNHVSNLDPIILGVACRRELNFMAKEGLFRNFLFGKLLYNVGAFPVKREYADVSAIKEAIRRLERGSVLLIFPAGSRSKGNSFQAQPGIGMLSSKASCPVLPVFISGTDKAMPPGAKFIKPTKIKVKFGLPLNFERSASYEIIASQVMSEIIALNPKIA